VAYLLVVEDRRTAVAGSDSTRPDLADCTEQASMTLGCYKSLSAGLREVAHTMAGEEGEAGLMGGPTQNGEAAPVCSRSTWM
jgi:hypothetical protein